VETSESRRHCFSRQDAEVAEASSIAKARNPEKSQKDDRFTRPAFSHFRVFGLSRFIRVCILGVLAVIQKSRSRKPEKAKARGCVGLKLLKNPPKPADAQPLPGAALRRGICRVIQKPVFAIDPPI